jgi:Kelch motif/Galactose oxidase, central domain
MPDDRDFEQRLRASLHREADRLPMRIDAASVRERMKPGPRLPDWVLPIALPIGAAVLVAVVVINAFPGDPGLQAGAGPSATTSTLPEPRESAAARSQVPEPAPTPHPAARAFAAVALGDEEAFLVGGVGERGSLRTVTRFDGRVWQDMPALPEPRVGAAAALLPDGRLIVTGGEVDRAPTATTLVLEPGSEAWTEGVALPFAQSRMGSAVVDGRVYLFGGSVAEHAADVLVFDPATDAWSQAAPMPIAASRVAVAHIDGAVFVFGGRTPAGDAGLSSALRYDVATDAWQALTPMPIAGNDLTATPVDGVIWIIGSEFGLRSVGTVATYDPAADTWTPNPDQTRQFVADWHMALPQQNGRILVITGQPFLTIHAVNVREP